MDIIDQESYKAGYNAGAIESYVVYRKRLEREYGRFFYFLKQKLVGVMFLAITFLAVKLLEGDATIAVFTVPFGLALIFSKSMFLVNDFYWEEKERNGKGGKKTSRTSKQNRRP